MLVRFLSYAASIIGARRYKPIVISCLAIIFSVSTIGIVATTLSGGSHDATSSAAPETAKNATDTRQNQQSANQLGGLDKKTPKDTSTQPTPAQTADPGASGSAKPSTIPAQPATLEISLNTTMISLSKTSPSASVMVTTTSNAAIQWNITADATVPGLTARIESAKDDMGNATARFNLDSTTPEGTYQFVITGKDPAHNLTASQTLTVTVN